MSDQDHRDLIQLGEDTAKMLKSQKKKHNTKSKKILDLLDKATQKYQEMASSEQQKNDEIRELQERIGNLLSSNGELAGVMSVLISAIEDYVGTQDENLNEFVSRATEMINDRIDEEVARENDEYSDKNSLFSVDDLDGIEREIE